MDDRTAVCVGLVPAELRVTPAAMGFALKNLAFYDGRPHRLSDGLGVVGNSTLWGGLAWHRRRRPNPPEAGPRCCSSRFVKAWSG